MTLERTYAAVYLGDGVVSVLIASPTGVAEFESRTVVSMLGSSLNFSVDPDFSVDDASTLDARTLFPFEFVDDANLLVGSTLVPAEVIFAGTLDAALGRAGEQDAPDLLEITVPSSWGAVRQNVVRQAAKALAREVVVHGVTTAVVQSVGERAPSLAVVVELGELNSVVSSVSDGAGDTPVWSGRWDEVGRRDIDWDRRAEASIENRVSECITALRAGGEIDIFVLESGPGECSPKILEDSHHRIHRLRGLDVVRSMAARVGVSTFGHPPAVSPSPVRSEAALPENELSGPPPARAAAWLDDAYTAAPRARVPPLGVLGIASVLVCGVVAAMFVLRPTPESSTSVTAQPSQSEQRPSQSVLAPTESAPDPASPLESAPPMPEVSPEIELARFDFGRVSIELPALWTEREEEGRVLLIPPDYPDRRIVVTAADLVPGTSFDEVADDLVAQFVMRGDSSSLESFSRATDFGGRIGVSYVETPDEYSVVHWQVFVEDDLQISIGCQSLVGSEEVLEKDCSHAVSTAEVSAVW